MAHPAPEPDDVPSGPIGPMTVEEYLEFEAASEGRHEYYNGFAWPMDATAMSGGSFAHNQIIVNVSARLSHLVDGTSCRVYDQSFRLRTASDQYFYPDLMVGCGPTPPYDALEIKDPCLAIEVLSPSTAPEDLGAKLDRYQAIPSLGTYLIVESRWRGVHRHWRDTDGTWRTEIASGVSEIPLSCPAGASLSLDDIYHRLDLPGDAPTHPTLRRVREELAEGTAYSAG